MLGIVGFGIVTIKISQNANKVVNFLKSWIAHLQYFILWNPRLRCLTLLQELKNNFISLLLSIQSKRRQHNIDGAPKKRYRIVVSSTEETKILWRIV